MLRRSLSRLFAGLGVSVLVSGVVTGGAAWAKTTITYYGWAVSPTQTQVTKTLLAMFEKQHPNIKVVNQSTAYVGDVGEFAKFATKAAAGVSPDVVWVQYQLLPRAAEAGMITDVSSFLAKDKSVKTNEWTDAGLAVSRWKGKVWGLPWAGNDWWISYVPRAFAEVGLQDPEKTYESGSWTMETMEAAAAKMTKFDGQKCTKIGLVMAGNNTGGGLSPWLMSWGLDFIDEATDTCPIDSAAGVAAFTHIYDLLYSKKSTTFQGGFPYPIDYPDVKKYGMLSQWRGTIGLMDALKSKLTFNQVPFPEGPISKYNNAASFHTLSISKQCKNKDAAWELVKFMCGKEAAAILARDVQWQSTRKDSIKVFADIMVSLGYTGNRFGADADARMRLIARSPRYDVATQKIEEQLNRGFNRKVDMALAVKAAAREANAALMRGKKK